MVEVETAPMSTLMPTLPARPPTPPREAIHNDSKSTLLNKIFGKSKSTSRRTSSISSITPDSSAESPNTSTGSVRKKVEWADQSLDLPTTSVEGTEIFHQAHEPLAASAERKPTKSILKAKSHNALGQEYNSAGVMNTKLLPPHHHATFATMLESITQQLAGTDRSSKMDAYLMLSGSLKASDNVPDVKALKDKMELLLSLVQRDLTEKTDTGKLDSSLIINALVLLSSFLHKPAIAEIITPEFEVYIVDHAIRTFEDGQMSKDIIKHLMFILAQQNFPAKIMNMERVGRLISALHQIESKNLKGKSIVVGRINIYRTLLRQSRPHMLVHQDWLEDLFTDMLSSLKEIRSQAITFGLEASFSLGAEPKISRTVSNHFQMEVNGKAYGDVYSSRLREMVHNKQDAAVPPAVPQTWSVVILFLRGRSRQLEQWNFMATFMEVIQACFNCSDNAAKKEALYAWNRFIYAVQPDEKTTPTLLRLLSQPLPSQMRRGSSRTATLSSLYCLLYYSLRPASSHAQLDLYWGEYVIPLVGKTLISVDTGNKPDLAKQGLAEACTILHSMFDPLPQRPWSETRVMENLQQNNFSAQELPALDSKWLRKSALKVFQVLDPLIEKLYRDLGEKSNVTLLWHAYIKSIASPAVMEVKVSNDTMTSVASIFGLLYRVWRTGPKAPTSTPLPKNEISESSIFLRSFENLATTMIHGLGPLPFTERQLCIATADTFIPIATPSQHPKKLRGQVKIPLHHLITLLATVCPGFEYSSDFIRVVHRILLPFFDARKTKQSRIELAKTLSEVLPSESTDPCRIVWQVLANFATSTIDTREGESNGHNDQPLGAGYRDVVKILEVGIILAPREPLSNWPALFDSAVNSATLDSGDAGRAMSIIEPLAKACLTSLPKGKVSPLGLFYFHFLIGKVSYPRDRQALDAASKRLWGVATTGPKGSFDPYVSLYEFVQLSLEVSYTSVNKHTIYAYSDIISSTSSLVKRCPFPLVLGVLSRIRNGLGLWILDSEVKTNGGNVLSQAAMSLWATISDILPRLLAQHSHTKLLSELEVLLCSGLESKHKTTVNAAIRLWNSTFGVSEQQLEYPERLKNVLLSLRPIADIQLPSFPTSYETEDVIDQRQPTDFAESQYDVENVLDSAEIASISKVHRPLPHLESSPITRRLRQTTPQVIIRSVSVKRFREETPESGQRKSRKREITPRLRHDDSQIQFEAVDSSPIVHKVVDSQLLTDRQKEVKERQQADAAMFPDIGFSPRSKTKPAEETNDGEIELPIYRSSSKLHSGPPNVERQNTPNLVAPSDDDQFVASSPTPTRSMRGEIEEGPPSSPPESPNKREPIRYEDVPSSPPEQPEEPEIDMTVSIDPSAQVDPYAIQQEVVTSTYGSTIDLSGILTAPDALQFQPVDQPAESTDEPNDEPNDQVKAEAKTVAALPESPTAQLEAEKIDIPSSATGQLQAENIEVPSSPKSQAKIENPEPQPYEHIEEIDETAIEPPETPTSTRLASPSVHHTPKTPQDAFVDALASPASSGRNTTDEVFEDAVSSPRLNIKKTHARYTSSPFSEWNDSSMVRAVEEAEGQTDQVDQPPQHVSTPDKENQTRRTRASPRKHSQQGPNTNSTPLSRKKPSLRKTSLLRQEQTFGYDKEVTSAEKNHPDSSIPSLIPETPAIGMFSTATKIGAEGEEFDPDDTIIVEGVPYQEDDAPIVSQGGKRKKLSTYSRKRKDIQTLEDQDEVPDSQDAQVEATEMSPEKPAIKKRRSNRPSKKSSQSSQPSQEFDTSIDLDQSQNVSVDLDASIQEVVDDSATDAFTSSAKEPEEEPEEEVNVQEKRRKEPSAVDEILQVAQTSEVETDEIHDDSAIKAQIQNGTTSFDIVAETTVDESSLLGRSSRERSSTEPVKPESDPVEEDVLGAASEVIEAPPTPASHNQPESSSAAPAADPKNLAPAPALEPEIPTVLTMKAKIESLLTDLQTASLSRNEVYELEDLFMDAKGLLYNAGKRGRKSVDI